MNATRNYTLFALTLTTMLLSAACLDDTIDAESASSDSTDSATAEQALEEIADEMGLGEDGSLGSMDDSDEEPAFGNDSFAREFGGEDLGGRPAPAPAGDTADRDGSCAQGVLAGRWARTRPSGGVFGGRWHSVTGDGQGFLAGRWGTTPSGEQVFHGKIINLEGRFRGFLSGTWSDGAFRGGRFGADGVQTGAMHGQTGGQHGHGHFRGFWRALCDADETAPDGSASMRLSAEQVSLDPSLSLDRLADAVEAIPVGAVTTEGGGELDVMCVPAGGYGDELFAECYLEGGENACTSRTFAAAFGPSESPVVPLQIAFDPIELWVLLGCPND